MQSVERPLVLLVVRKQTLDEQRNARDTQPSYPARSWECRTLRVAGRRIFGMLVRESRCWRWVTNYEDGQNVLGERRVLVVVFTALPHEKRRGFAAW